jgi:hypothetical protein
MTDQEPPFESDESLLLSLLAEMKVPEPGVERWQQFDDDFGEALAQLGAPDHQQIAPLVDHSWSWRQSMTPLAAAAAFLMILTLLGTLSNGGSQNFALAYQSWEFHPDSYHKRASKRVAVAPVTDLTLKGAQQQFQLNDQELLQLKKYQFTYRRGADKENLVRQYEAWLGQEQLVLVTPELATVIYEGMIRRVSQKVELYELQPRLIRLLQSTIKSLCQFRLLAVDEGVRRACDRALEYLGTAALLMDQKSPLPRVLRQRCQRELDRIEAAVGVYYSEIRGEDEDYSAYVSRSPYRHDRELQKYERMVRWLTRASLKVDPTRPVDLQAAMLLVVASAQAREFASWNNIDEIISLLFGPADDMGMLDLRRVMQSRLGLHIKSLKQLFPRQVAQSIAKDLARHGQFHKKGLITGVGEGRTPVFRFIGGSRNVDALAAASLTGDDPNFLRHHAQILDLPVVLGQAEALRLSLESEQNSAQFLQRVDSARESIFRAGSVSFLERSRLDRARGLLNIKAGSDRESRRLLSAAISSFDERPGAHALSQKEAPALNNPGVLVEPFPEFFDHLAYASGQVLKGLPKLKLSKEVTQVLAELKQVHQFLKVLARHARQAAEGRARGDRELGQSLRQILPAFRDSASWTARTLNEVEYPDRTEYSQRLVGGADTLVRAVMVLENGDRKLRFARGGTLAVKENYGPKRLVPEQSTQADRPLWMLDWSH